MKTSMMDLQTSTLTLSFWNMSKNGRKRSWETETLGNIVKLWQKSFVIDYFMLIENTRFIVWILDLLTMEKRREKSWK